MNSRHNPDWIRLPHGRVTVLSALGLLAVLMFGSAAGAEPELVEVFTVGREAVRGDQGQDYAQFREQNVVVTNSGTVVVVCQGRNKSRWSDRSGQDLVVKTSNDSGKTWSEARLVVTHDRKSICPNAAVYDSRTNCIHVLYNLFMSHHVAVQDVSGTEDDVLSYLQPVYVDRRFQGQP